MERAAENLQSQPNAAKPESRTAASGLLQRKCACGGGGSPGLAGECGECGKKRLRLQRFSISGQLTTNSRPAHGHAANHHAMHNDAASNHAARAQAANKRATGRQSANVNGAEQAEPAAAVSPIVHQVLRAPGQPLRSQTRALMEASFGHDFSRVRVHTDAKAAESARSIEAQAYTVGRDVVFGAGRYAPETAAGQRLLAHELAHVVQQKDATYPSDGITLADAKWEHEADAAAEAVLANRPARVAQIASGAQLSRKPVYQDRLIVREDAMREVQVERTVKPGKCAQIPETRKSADGNITIDSAKISLSYCRGTTLATATGELDYSDIIARARNAVPDLLRAPNVRQGASDLKQSAQQAQVAAKIQGALKAGGLDVQVTGTATGSIGGGVSGTATAEASGRIGSTKVTGGASVEAGTQQPTTFNFNLTLAPGSPAPQIPDCFRCDCPNPQVTYQCSQRETTKPETPDRPPVRQIEHVPLFFEYAKTARLDEGEYRGAYEEGLEAIINYLREGYTIARIEGRASPEGPLRRRRPGGFENITLAGKRAGQAQLDVQAALDAAIAREAARQSLLTQFRGKESEALRLLRAARAATNYTVGGQAPGGGPKSAELFGLTDGKETPDRELLETMRERLKKPDEGDDPLAVENVIGERLPANIRARVQADVDAFRNGVRDGRKLKDPVLLETIFRPLRRALVVLNPPTVVAPPLDLRLKRENVEKIIGQPFNKLKECDPKHTAEIDKIPIPESAQHEGECRPPGIAGPGGERKVR